MRWTLAAIPVLLFGVSGQAQTLPRPVVVELFTSQGCSSCPPADAVLAELARGQDVLALGFHVTYWNNLGWKDPYSLDVATARQRFYQSVLNTESIYTPQMVIDGRLDVVGSDVRGVTAAIAQTAARLRAQPSVAVHLQRAPSGIVIDVGAGDGTASVILVGYDTAHRTQVARGENSGRELFEANIVRSYDKIGEWKGGALHLSGTSPAAERAAVILQAPDGKIIGAAKLQEAGQASG